MKNNNGSSKEVLDTSDLDREFIADSFKPLAAAMLTAETLASTIRSASKLIRTKDGRTDIADRRHGLRRRPTAVDLTRAGRARSVRSALPSS